MKLNKRVLIGFVIINILIIISASYLSMINSQQDSNDRIHIEGTSIILSTSGGTPGIPLPISVDSTTVSDLGNSTFLIRITIGNSNFSNEYQFHYNDNISNPRLFVNDSAYQRKIHWYMGIEAETFYNFSIEGIVQSDNPSIKNITFFNGTNSINGWFFYRRNYWDGAQIDTLENIGIGSNYINGVWNNEITANGLSFGIISKYNYFRA